MASSKEIRHSVINILLLLSSKEQQFAFHQKSPTVNVALELLCLWFNELYNPGSPLFKRAFSENEYAAIQEFNRYYDVIKRKLPTTVDELFHDESWHIVMQHAKVLLDTISEKQN